MANDILLEVNNLKKYFPIRSGNIFQKEKLYVKAVDNVSFKLRKGETLGLVGESGCGKTTCGRTVLKIYDPTEGQIIYKGQDIAKLSKKEMIPYRKHMQMIFQDPYASLDPRMMVGDTISEGMLEYNKNMSQGEVKDKVCYLLDKVGLNREFINRYPHEFSGGQRQRIGIARALAMDPEFIVCDEPISALDVSIQAQVINMLEELQEEMGLTYLFIAHDLCMVKHISTNIGVMYLGNMVEIGTANEVYDHPQHPYTQALLSAVPLPDPEAAKKRQRIVLQGDVPSPINVPKGCPFSGRCRFATERCKNEKPGFTALSDTHSVACFLYE
ncbi:MAG: ATP-binding cassette domain-containing protein [Lachnospiraceae bacterium]|nr:ATP-binding cassette domain-containing protein [Lachnospiraceae bacterium]